MRMGWSRLGVTKAVRYKENGTMVFFESLRFWFVLWRVGTLPQEHKI